MFVLSRIKTLNFRDDVHNNVKVVNNVITSFCPKEKIFQFTEGNNVIH